MAAISACIDSWNWEDLLVSGLVPSIGNQTLPSLFRRSSTSPIPFLRFFLLDTHPFLHAVANVASRHSARSSFARTLADSSRVISPATSRGRITPYYVLRDFTWAEACRDVEKNDIPRSLSRKTVDGEEREKKLRIFSPCLLSSKGFLFFFFSSFCFFFFLLFRNNVVVPFSPIV